MYILHTFEYFKVIFRILEKLHFYRYHFQSLFSRIIIIKNNLHNILKHIIKKKKN